jgi:hypothetical protein
MSEKQFIIDPDAKIEYGFNWAGWLPTGTTIATSTWAITPEGPTLSSGSNSTMATVIYVNGCTDGVTYTLTNRITVSGAVERTDDRSMTLVCRER